MVRNCESWLGGYPQGIKGSVEGSIMIPNMYACSQGPKLTLKGTWLKPLLLLKGIFPKIQQMQLCSFSMFFWLVVTIFTSWQYHLNSRKSKLHNAHCFKCQHFVSRKKNQQHMFRFYMVDHNVDLLILQLSLHFWNLCGSCSSCGHSTNPDLPHSTL